MHFLLLFLACVVDVIASAAILTHDHRSKGVVRPCPNSECIMDGPSDLFFWKFVDMRFPLINLNSAKGNALPVITRILDSGDTLVLSKEMSRELQSNSNGRPLIPVRADFPYPDIRDGYYELLFNDDNMSFTSIPMQCRYVKNPWWKKPRFHISCVVFRDKKINRSTASNAT